MAKQRGAAARPERWKDEPAEHDYPAAADYLSLLFSESETAAIVKKLSEAALVRRKAKDLLRASSLELLPESDAEVKADLKKVAAGHPLSPVLLVRRTGDARLIVADGYHRICASYHLDESAEVPCRLVDAS